MMGMFGVSHGIKNVIREMIRQQVEAKQKSVLKYLSVRFSTVRQSRLHMDSEIQINAEPQWVVLHTAHVSGFGPWAASCAPWQCVCSCGAVLKPATTAFYPACGVLSVWAFGLILCGCCNAASDSPWTESSGHQNSCSTQKCCCSSPRLALVKRTHCKGRFSYLWTPFEHFSVSKGYYH